MNPSKCNKPQFGAGLRTPHLQNVLASQGGDVDIWELLADNWYSPSVAELNELMQIRASKSMTVHSVGVSLGSTDLPELSYVKSLQHLVQQVDPVFVSDHASFSRADGRFVPDLLPLPFTGEAIDVLVRNIGFVQDFLRRQICLENVSRYVDFKSSEMKEWEFLNAVAKRSGCGLLVDINNVYVNERNTGASAIEFLENIDPSLVMQFHVSGHFDKGAFCIDDHGRDVCASVWELVHVAFRKIGVKTSIVEWDQDLPSYDVLMSEVAHLRSIAANARGEG